LIVQNLKYFSLSKISSFQECASTNVKVRTAALGIIGELHKQLGPVFKALVLSDKASGPVKPQIESTIDANPFDPSEKSMPRNKSCIASGSSVPGSSTSGSSEGLGMEIPKTDLVASLPRDCLTNLVRFTCDFHFFYRILYCCFLIA
jgi:hypothetical protein